MKKNEICEFIQISTYGNDQSTKSSNIFRILLSHYFFFLCIKMNLNFRQAVWAVWMRLQGIVAKLANQDTFEDRQIHINRVVGK